MTDPSSELNDPIKLEPAVSGSTGAQEAVSTGHAVAGPITVGTIDLDQRHLGAALHNTVDVRNAVISRIAVAAFDDGREHVARLTSELDKCRNAKAVVESDYHQERERRIRLEVRGEGSRYAQVAQLVGSLVAGAGLSLLIQQKWGLGVLLTLVGATVAVLGILQNNRRVAP